MIRKLIAVLALATAMITGVAITATPAQASITRCEPTYRLCVYDQTNFLGNTYVWTPIPGPGCYNLGIAPNGINWSDRIRSVRMNSAIKVRFYKDFYCNGAWVTQQLSGYGSTGYEHCLNTWGKWYVSASPCTAPSASSFWIFS